jgi:hypothetical protein
MIVSVKLPRKVGGTLTVNLSDFGFPESLPEIAIQIARYGLQQKLGDASVAKLGKDADPESLRRQIDHVLAQLRQGIWNEKRIASGETFDSFLVRHFVNLAKARDKRLGKEDTPQGYAARARAAIANPAFASIVEAKKAEWEALQASHEDDIDI